MRWRPYKLKDGSNAANTICSERGYAILRSTRDGKPDGRFLAFRYVAYGIKVIGGYDSADDAKAACEHHAAKEEVAA